MKLINRVRPNYRDKISTQRIMRDLTIALAVLTLYSVYYYTTKVDLQVGLRVLYVVLTAVIVNVVIEIIFGLFQKRTVKEVFNSQFPWVTGLILALAVPVNTSLYAVGATTAIAVIFGKVLFGGFGQNIFNPAGIGRAIIFASFSKAVVDLGITNDILTSATPATAMNSFGWLPSTEALGSKAFAHLTLGDVAMGNHFGTIGETFSLIIIACGIFLVIRRAIDWRIPVVYVGTLFVSALVIGLLNGVGYEYALMFVMSGGVLFGAVFMLTDPVTCPTQRTGRVIFAFGAAILTLIIRFKANLPEGVVFSILIMNMLTPMIEDFLDGQQTRMKAKYLYSTLAMILLTAVTVTWITTTTVAKEPELAVNDETITVEAKDIEKYKVLDIQSTKDGDNTVFTVQVQGYGLKAEYPKPEYKENIFVVTVDKDNKIVKAEMEQFGDTEGIGDVVNDALYFDRFVGKDLSNTSEEYDTVTGATVTSHSFISVLKAISEEIGK